MTVPAFRRPGPTRAVFRVAAHEASSARRAGGPAVECGVGT